MAYLASFKITPNLKEIEVDCFGTVEPYQKETLEQQGCPEYVILEGVEHDGTVITDYLDDRIIEALQNKLNEK